MVRAAVVIGVILALTGCEYIPGTESATARQGEQIAADLLNDPSSAQFRGVEVREGEGGTTAVCGEINGKNLLGAYSGFRRFLADTAGGFVVIDQPIDPDMTRQIDDAMRLCLDTGRARCDTYDRLVEQQAHHDGFVAVWDKHCA